MTVARRLLTVAYTFPPYGTVGHVIRLVKFARYLPEFGWRPTILTIADDERLQFFERNSHFLLGELPADLRVVRTSVWQPSVKWAKSRRAALAGHTRLRAAWPLHWHLIQFVRRQLLVPDIGLPWIPVAVREAKRLGRQHCFDAVLASIPLNTNGVVGALVARWLGVPLVVDVRDDWVGGAYYSEKGPLARAIERRLERYVFRSARAVVLVSPLSLEQHRERFPRWQERFVYIPNGVDLADLPPTTPLPPSRPDRLLLVHSGMTGPLRSPVPLLRAIREVVVSEPAAAAPRIELILVGNLLPEHRRAIAELGLEGIVISRPYLATADYHTLLMEADVLVAIADRDYPTEIPGKVYTHWALQRPTLLLAGSGAAAQLVVDYGLGWTIAPTDHAGLVTTLKRLRDQKAAGSLPVARRDGIERFDRRCLTAELAQLLERVAARRAAPASL